MTGSIQNAVKIALRNLRGDALHISFTNGSTSELKAGQEVLLKADGTVEARTSGTGKPFGIVYIGGLADARVTVRTTFTAELNGIATEVIVPGDLLVPDGDPDANGIPKYKKGATGNFSMAIALTNGALNGAVKVGIVDGYFKI